MFPIPESYPPPFRFPEIKDTLFLNQKTLKKLKAFRTIEEIGLISTLGIRVVVNPSLDRNKALWFDGSGKMQILDLSRFIDEA